MKTTKLLGLPILLAALSLLGAGTARADAYTWTPTAAGTTYSWIDAANWGGANYPGSGATDTASLTANLLGAETIGLNAVVSLGSLTVGDSGGTVYAYTIASGSSGTLAFQSGATIANTAGANVISAPVSIADTLGINSASGSSLTFSGAIGSSGGVATTITKTGAGGLTFASSYAGTLAINAGSASASANATIANVVVNGGTTFYLNNGSHAGSLTVLGGTVSNSYGYVDNVIFMAGGTITTGSPIYGSHSAVRIFNDGSGNPTVSTFGAAMSSIYTQQVLVDQNATGLFNGVWTGSVGLVKDGAGTATFTKANTYTGTTTINQGVLSANTIGNAGVSGSLGNGPSSGVGIILNGGTLQYTGAGESTNRQIQLNTGSSSSSTANPLGGAATYTKNNTTSALDASGTGAVNYTNTTLSLSGTSAVTFTLTGTNTGANTFAAAMKDNTLGKFTLNKTGAGKWVVTGTSTYTGATSVTGGTLLVNGALGATTVSVSGGTFGGSGTVGGAVTVGAGGVLSPGSDAATIGTLAIAAATLTDGASLAFDIDTAAGTSDLLSIAGNLSLSGTVNLVLSDLGGNAAFNGTLTLATYTGTWNGGLLSYNGVALADGSSFVYGADAYTIHYGATALTLTAAAAVPEPSTWALAALGAGFLVLVRARRRECRAGEVV